MVARPFPMTFYGSLGIKKTIFDDFCDFRIFVFPLEPLRGNRIFRHFSFFFFWKKILENHRKLVKINENYWKTENSFLVGPVDL